jgi:hypothetical protein
MKDKELLMDEFTAMGTPFFALEAELQDLLAQQEAAPSRDKFHFRTPIARVEGKMRRIEDPVLALRGQLVAADKAIHDIKGAILDLKSRIAPEALTRRELLEKVITKALELVGAHPQAYFGGTAMIGKDCERICSKSDDFVESIRSDFDTLLRQWLKPGPQLNDALDDLNSRFEDLRILLGVIDQIFSILRVPRRLKEEDFELLENVIPLFEAYWGRLFSDKDGGLFSSIPIKVHIVPGHVVDFARMFGFLGLGSEEAGENEIHIDKVDSRGTQASNHNFKAQQLQNFNRRKLRYNPEQIAAMKEAIGLTAKGPRKGTAEKRKASTLVKEERREAVVEEAKKKTDEA